MSDFRAYLVRLTAMPGRMRAVGTIVVLMTACLGCRPTTSTVAGVVTIDGKPIKLSTDTRGTVVFQPAGGQGAMATGVLDATGHFKLATGAMSEIAPGKYQIAISVVQLLPASEGSEQAGKRLTPAKYSSAIDSGLQADVVPGENNLKFDLSSAEEPAETPSAAVEAPVETDDAVTAESPPGK